MLRNIGIALLALSMLLAAIGLWCHRRSHSDRLDFLAYSNFLEAARALLIAAITADIIALVFFIGATTWP